MLAVDRTARITSLIDVAAMKGLEVGALHHPVIQRAGAQVRYVDHASTEDLRRKYANDASGEHVVETMVDVDFVWPPGTRLVDAVSDWAPVEYVVASHVLEHVADPIDWLTQVGEVLTDSGLLCLAVSDKRFTVAARRPMSTTGQLVDAHVRSATRPSPQQHFDDALYRLAAPDTVALWHGKDPRSFARAGANPAVTAYQTCLDQAGGDGSQDVHANTFTAESFVEVLVDLATIDLLPYAVADFVPTKRYELEFVVALQRLPASLKPTARRARQEAGFALCRERLARADRIEFGRYDDPPTLPSLSDAKAYARREGTRLVRGAARRARTGADAARERAAAFRERSGR